MSVFYSLTSKKNRFILIFKPFFSKHTVYTAIFIIKIKNSRTCKFVFVISAANIKKLSVDFMKSLDGGQIGITCVWVR